MSNKPKKVKICTICGKPVEKGQSCLTVKTKHGDINLHHECMRIEQEELKAEKEGKA